MSLLPQTLVALDSDGKPLPANRCYDRFDARSSLARALAEADWDAIICANVDALSASLRAAGVIAADSTLRVLGRQIDSVDVLLVEIPEPEVGGPAPQGMGEPRRLVLLEDKLVRNPQAKREVVAQILDYAQRAQANWTAEDLIDLPELAPHTEWLRRHGPRLNVALAEGDLLLVIAGDDIDDDLLRLARRVAGSNDPLCLNELCLVSMAMYQRGEERLLIPHVVSAVERHQRQLTIRVRVERPDGTPLRAHVERDVPEDVAARRAPSPGNADARSFLLRAKAALDPQLLGEATQYEGTKSVTKNLGYYGTDESGGAIRFKIHFGPGGRDIWTPIQVGLLVESEALREFWRARVEDALATGQLPAETKTSVFGKQSVLAVKEFTWNTPDDLTDVLLAEVVETLVVFERVLGLREGAARGSGESG